MFFALQPKQAFLSDINIELINLYNVVRDSPEALLNLMNVHQRLHSYNHYYEVRSASLSSRVEKAAQFLYLNRTCWNGLYRVNKNGVFNVPKGTKDSVLFPSEDFLTASTLLKNAIVSATDFESALDCCKSGDFAFIDPPYALKKQRDSFVKYNGARFSWKDQLRLRDVVIGLCERRVSMIITNANDEDIKQIYGGIDELQAIQVRRQSIISGNVDKRTSISEMMFATRDVVNISNRLVPSQDANKSSLAAGARYEIINP